MHLFVGSQNPVKINAVTQAASALWPDVRVIGFEIPSGISEQPRTDDETKAGAQARAKGALEKGLKESTAPETTTPTPQTIPTTPDQQLGLGMEGGVFEKDGEMWCTVWACVADTENRMVCTNGARFPVPDEIAQMIRDGGEMGPLVAKMAGIEDLKRKQGMIGLISNYLLTRTEEYSAIIKTSLGIWYGQFKPWQNQ